MFKIVRGAKTKYYETYDRFNMYWAHHSRYNRWGVDVIGYELVEVRPDNPNDPHSRNRDIWEEIRKTDAL